MLFLKYLLLLTCFGLLALAAGAVLYDIYLTFELGRLLGPGEEGERRLRDSASRARPRRRRVIEPKRIAIVASQSEAQKNGSVKRAEASALGHQG
jgi:hypothetical protein